MSGRAAVGGERSDAEVGDCERERIGGVEARQPIEREQGAQCFLVVRDRGDGHAVVAIILQRVKIGAGLHERVNRLALAGESRDMERRAAVRVAGLDTRAACGQTADGGDIASLRCRVQPCVEGRFGFARWHLSLRRHRARQDDAENRTPDADQPREAVPL